MSMSRLVHNESGASAAEFALVLPLLILLLFGIIDAGRFGWEYNKAEKATQAGARVAIVTQIIPQGLADFQYVNQTVGGTAYLQGDPLQASALGLISCQRVSGTLACNCATVFCPSLGTANTAGFNAIAARMQGLYPNMSADNVIVEYRGSGVGYAGDPSGMDISPLVTVKLTGMTFNPLMLFGQVNVPLPEFRTTLTAEDSANTASN